MLADDLEDDDVDEDDFDEDDDDGEDLEDDDDDVDDVDDLTARAAIPNAINQTLGRRDRARAAVSLRGLLSGKPTPKLQTKL